MESLMGAECVTWLETFLWPLTRATAGRRSETAEEVLAEVRQDPDVQVVEDPSTTLSAAEGTAIEASGELRVVTTAMMAAHLAGDDSAAVTIRDAVLLLVYQDVLEYTAAAQLAQDASDALYPDGTDAEFDERERLAELAVDRWRALDEPVGAGFLDLVGRCAGELSTVLSRC